MSRHKNTDAGQTVIDLLSNRKGFDYWWEEISPENQEEIVMRLNELVQLREKPQ